MRALPAALLGGLIALVLVYFLALVGLLPARDQRAANALQRVGTAEQSIASLRAAIPSATDLAGFSDRLVRLETGLGDIQTRLTAGGAGGGDLAAQIATLSADVANLRAEISAAAGANPGAIPEAGVIAALDQRLTALEATGPIGQQSAPGPDLALEVADLDQRLSRVEGAPDVADAAQRTAETLAVAVLRSAADRGGPFKAELDLVTTLGLQGPALDALAPLAEAGVPTAASLAASFEDGVIDAILAATEAPAADAGAFEQILGGLRSLVSVRPTGPVEGTSPVAIVSRIRADLAAGDPAAALAEWESLPETGKTASADWATGLKNRVAVDTALAELAVAPPGGAG